MAGKKGKDNDGDVKSSGDSVHSEPPPAYTSSGHEGNGDIILKSTPKVHEGDG